MERAQEEKVDFGKLLRTVEKELGLRLHTADLAKYLQQAVQEIRGMPEQDFKTLAGVEVDELQVLLDAANFLSEQLGCKKCACSRPTTLRGTIRRIGLNSRLQ